MENTVATVKDGSIREKLLAVVEGKPFVQFITVLILINAVTLGLETSERIANQWVRVLAAIEAIVLSVFVAEMAVKLFCYRFRFFRSGWRLLDLFIVCVSLIPTSAPLSILRSLRVLRVLRLFSTVPRLRSLTEALLSSLPSMGWIIVMLAAVFYVFAVLGTQLFGTTHPEWFGTLGASTFSLFQVMTLESWSMGIARPVMAVHAWSWIYFVSFILVSSFTILNLFVGIIVNSMQRMHWEEEEQKRDDLEALAHAEREEMLDLIRETATRVRALERRL